MMVGSFIKLREHDCVSVTNPIYKFWMISQLKAKMARHSAWEVVSNAKEAKESYLLISTSIPNEATTATSAQVARK